MPRASTGCAGQREAAVDDRRGRRRRRRSSRESAMSWSPVLGSVVVDARDLELVDARRAALIVSGPSSALASWIAARSVHRPALVAQTPLPGLLSGRSAVSLTTSGNPAAPAGSAFTVRTRRARSRVRRAVRAGERPSRSSGTPGEAVVPSMAAMTPSRTAPCEMTPRQAFRGRAIRPHARAGTQWAGLPIRVQVHERFLMNMRGFSCSRSADSRPPAWGRRHSSRGSFRMSWPWARRARRAAGFLDRRPVRRPPNAATRTLSPPGSASKPRSRNVRRPSSTGPERPERCGCQLTDLGPDS